MIYTLSVILVFHACLTFCSVLMANHVNAFVDNVHLNISNSFTHILDAENNDELNIIQCSLYSSDDLVIQSRENCENGLNELSEFTCKI